MRRSPIVNRHGTYDALPEWVLIATKIDAIPFARRDGSDVEDGDLCISEVNGKIAYFSHGTWSISRDFYSAVQGPLRMAGLDELADLVNEQRLKDGR